MALLSRLVLLSGINTSQATESLRSDLAGISKSEFEGLESLAGKNHVLVRAMKVDRDLAHECRDDTRQKWAEQALEREKSRIENALPFLYAICNELKADGEPVAVMKTLDHWPDFGSDLDLYTNAKPAEVISLMMRKFDSKLAPRSMGDRLACKWNFIVPGLPELVEIHVGRLGQTGEQFQIATTLLKRTQQVSINGFTFCVPSNADRLMISTLQRMYRHFFFRLCDIVDSASLHESGNMDYESLRSGAIDAGIWEGVATYLVIVSDYLKQWRGVGLDLPVSVCSAARFRGDQIYFANDFLRVPILPHSAMLYNVQLARLLQKRQLLSGARLGLLPWLATAALIGQKVTGSDKGIW